MWNQAVYMYFVLVTLVRVLLRLMIDCPKLTNQTEKQQRFPTRSRSVDRSKSGFFSRVEAVQKPWPSETNLKWKLNGN